VCLSVLEDISGTTRACMLPMSVDRSSYGMLITGRIACRREGADGSAQRGRSVIYEMGFFDNIDNSTIVDTLKQLFNGRDREIFFTDIPQTATFPALVKDHKIHTLARHHQTVSMSVLSEMANLESVNNHGICCVRQCKRWGK